MAKKNYTKSEQSIEKLFPLGSTFSFGGKEYTVELCGKPRPASGECKTDLYIKGKSQEGEEKEIKISVKQNDADFLENKISLDRAKQIFGEKASDIIRSSLSTIEDSFRNDYLVCFKKYKRTDAHTIKLGWKFELLNKNGGEKSGMIMLNDSQKYDVYAGINLPEGKRNCHIEDCMIENSGVANFLLMLGKGSITREECINKLVPIEEYAKAKTLYFACKALNYRFNKVGKKWDGDRPLSVYVDWRIKDNLLNADLIFRHPLEHKGNEIGEKLQSLLEQLEIEKFDDLKGKLSPDIKCFLG
jgi:hypothetical protein